MTFFGNTIRAAQRIPAPTSGNNQLAISIAMMGEAVDSLKASQSALCHAIGVKLFEMYGENASTAADAIVAVVQAEMRKGTK